MIVICWIPGLIQAVIVRSSVSCQAFFPHVLKTGYRYTRALVSHEHHLCSLRLGISTDLQVLLSIPELISSSFSDSQCLQSVNVSFLPPVELTFQSRRVFAHFIEGNSYIPGSALFSFSSYGHNAGWTFPACYRLAIRFDICVRSSKPLGAPLRELSFVAPPELRFRFRPSRLTKWPWGIRDA